MHDNIEYFFILSPKNMNFDTGLVQRIIDY